MKLCIKVALALIVSFLMVNYLCFYSVDAEAYLSSSMETKETELINSLKATSDFTFNLLSDDTYEVIGYSGTSTIVSIPSTYNGKKVTSAPSQGCDS